MRKQIFLHLGAHKAATTLIQTSILSPENLARQPAGEVVFISAHNPAYQYLDFRIPYTHGRNKILWNINSGKEPPQHIADEMVEHIQEYVGGISENKIVWSDENLLGATPGHPVGQIKTLTAGIYPAAKYIAQIFSRALYDRDVYVRLYTRDIESLQRSSYADLIAKLRAAISFNEFSKQLTAESTSWEYVSEEWQRCFGSKFDTAKYESIVEGRMDFLQEFAAWANIKFDCSELSPSGYSNRSLTQRQVEVALLNIPHIRENERASLMKFLRSLH